MQSRSGGTAVTLAVNEFSSCKVRVLLIIVSNASMIRRFITLTTKQGSGQACGTECRQCEIIAPKHGTAQLALVWRQTLTDNHSNCMSQDKTRLVSSINRTMLQVSLWVYIL